MSKYLFGNWKMNSKRADYSVFFDYLHAEFSSKDFANDVYAAIFPPALYLDAAAALKPDWLRLGAQSISPVSGFGARTGEHSAQMLNDFAVAYALVGHSERRQYAHESEKDFAKQMASLLESQITPVYCIGETFEQKEMACTKSVLSLQLRTALCPILGLLGSKQIMIAYEPVWAIGTGMTPEPQDIHDLTLYIQGELASLGCANTAVLYGGSVAPNNISLYSEINGLSGFLVGGASLDQVKFAAMIREIVN